MKSFAAQTHQFLAVRARVDDADASSMGPSFTSRFADISMEELITDPVGSIGVVYSQFGMTMSSTFIARLEEWKLNNSHAPVKHLSTALPFSKFEVVTEFAKYVFAHPNVMPGCKIVNGMIAMKREE